MKIFYLILILSVCKITQAAECDVSLTGSESICTYFTKTLSEKDEHLPENLCICFGGVLYNRGAECASLTDGYEFVPACATLFHSPTYLEIASSDFVRSVAQLILTAIVGVCRNSEPEVQKSIDNFFQRGIVSNILEAAIKGLLPAESATLINSCYAEIREVISPRPKEN